MTATDTEKRLTVNSWHCGPDYHEVRVEQHGSEWRVFATVNGRCEDARRVLRFSDEATAMAAAVKPN